MLRLLFFGLTKIIWKKTRFCTMPSVWGRLVHDNGFVFEVWPCEVFMVGCESSVISSELGRRSSMRTRRICVKPDVSFWVSQYVGSHHKLWMMDQTLGWSTNSLRCEFWSGFHGGFTPYVSVLLYFAFVGYGTMCWPSMGFLDKKQGSSEVDGTKWFNGGIYHSSLSPFVRVWDLAWV